MDLIKAMNERNSVRRYTDEPLSPEIISALNAEIAKVCEKSGLNIQLITNEPEAFTGTMASYGHFSGCTDYIAICAPNGKSEEIGYYGEHLVLVSQALGLNSCWVALTFNKAKTKFKAAKGEKLQIVISLGYGIHCGRPHKNKPISEICSVYENAPEWFKNGIDAVMKAPTAINQQKFYFKLNDDNTVTAKSLLGPYSKMDLGIAKYHFELGAGKNNFEWR